MATVNENLENLTLEDVNRISKEYLLGWHNLEKYGFRLQGLNSIRSRFGLEPLTKEWSLQYQIAYVKGHHTDSEILSAIKEYCMTHRVDRERWTGIMLFGCRFGRNYADAFRLLIGEDAYSRVSEECRVHKLVKTQMEAYGGVGVGGKATYDKMHATIQERYGVNNVMQADCVKANIISPFCDEKTRRKAQYARWKHSQEEIADMISAGDINSSRIISPTELTVYQCLVECFGKNDVFYQYGLHPYDSRYPYNCDFYIKSWDLFIEINADYCHGGHWYDDSNHDDQMKRRDMLLSPKRRTRTAVKIWTETDVMKRECAKKSGIKYLVFWDSGTARYNKKRFPRLSDFYMWFDDYACDYRRFIQDFPGNTY